MKFLGGGKVFYAVIFMCFPLSPELSLKNQTL